MKFGCVGALGFAVDVTVLNALAFVGADPLWARPPAILVATLATWAANRRYTFRATGESALWQYLRHLGSQGFGATVNYGAFAAAVHSFDFSPTFAVAIGSLTAMAVNYVTAEAFVYRRRDAA